jgi:sugar transferase (PEP-CTERM/EpsH1 system associated)
MSRSNEQLNASTDENSIQKEPLLFLCHRIPFPPNKGDKIRSFNILKKLSEQYEIHLGCFIDDPFDKQYVSGLQKYCASIFHLDQHKTLSKIKGLTGFLTNKPITLPYYFDKRMQQWTHRVIAQHKISKVFVYSSSMAQYVQGENAHAAQFSSLDRIIDFVDIDSDKWRQYAMKKTGLANWFFNREYRLLAQVENDICVEFDHSLFVSPDEAQLFSERQALAQKSKVHGLLNGVDIDFFDPKKQFEQEALVPNLPFITFTGAMDYWANVDAVLWFTDNVWPLILAKNPEAIFCIVGGNPSSDVTALAKQQGVIVTGRVHDVRPFINQAECVVAPLQIARGIQNKVLEAMSLNKAIVVTPMAMEGINAKANEAIVITDNIEEYAHACLTFLTKKEAKKVTSREWIIEQFTWPQTLEPLLGFFTKREDSNDSR